MSFLGKIARKTTPGGNSSVASALRAATANSPAPLQPQELLYLMGAAAREPPALASSAARPTLCSRC